MEPTGPQVCQLFRTLRLPFVADPVLRRMDPVSFTPESMRGYDVGSTDIIASGPLTRRAEESTSAGTPILRLRRAKEAGRPPELVRTVRGGGYDGDVDV